MSPTLTLTQTLLDLGGWGVSLFGIVLFLFALFREDAWIYSKGRNQEMRQELKQETIDLRERIKKEQERSQEWQAEAERWQEKYIEKLKEDIAERKERDRTLELVAKSAERRH
jgi:uncharacterized protein YlxW (UPF0749 family)